MVIEIKYYNTHAFKKVVLLLNVNKPNIKKIKCLIVITHTLVAWEIYNCCSKIAYAGGRVLTNMDKC